jgi:hypothetical protein
VRHRRSVHLRGDDTPLGEAVGPGLAVFSQPLKVWSATFEDLAARCILVTLCAAPSPRAASEDLLRHGVYETQDEELDHELHTSERRGREYRPIVHAFIGAACEPFQTVSEVAFSEDQKDLGGRRRACLASPAKVVGKNILGSCSERARTREVTTKLQSVERNRPTI